MGKSISSCFCTVILFLLFGVVPGNALQAAKAVEALENNEASTAAPIPADELKSLQSAVEKAGVAKPGSADLRRACKRVIRKGDGLLKKHPAAPNRFQILGVMLRNQKKILALEKNDRNREKLYHISTALRSAPDEWVSIRLEADLILTERDLASKNAPLEEWTEALTALIMRYRGTTAEAKSLMMTALIGKDLESREFNRFIEAAMDERCSGDPRIIAFRRNVLSLKSLRVKCRGEYKRADGARIYIPGDRFGHQSLLVYWSQQSTSSERYMTEIKKQQERYPGAFEVYSFNLDELPDAGEKHLRGMGLDWQAMHLPQGQRNPFYQAYGGQNPVALFANGFGYTVLNPFGANPDAMVGVHGIDASDLLSGLNGGPFVHGEMLQRPRHLAGDQNLGGLHVPGGEDSSVFVSLTAADGEKGGPQDDRGRALHERAPFLFVDFGFVAGAGPGARPRRVISSR